MDNNTEISKPVKKEAFDQSLVNENIELFDEHRQRKDIGSFKIEGDTLYKMHYYADDEKPPKKTFVSRNTPFVTRRLKDIESGQVYFTIKFKDRGRYIHKDVKASSLITKRDLIMLSDDGLGVTENNAKTLIDFMDLYINEHEIREEEMTTRIGYINGKFIHPQDEDINIIQSGGYQSLIDAFKSKSDLNKYANEVFQPISNEKTAVFFMLGTLASPLLKHFDIDPFIMDLSGRTSAGKTTLLRVCSSIWGTKDLIGEWNLTKVALERKAAFLNNFPLFLDDTRKASPYVLKDVVYHFSGGKSKGRGNIKSIDEELTYHNILISTGEVAITEYNSEMGGIAARVVSIENEPFKNINEYFDLYAALDKHYGTLGTAFMKMYHSDKKYYDTTFQTLETQYFNDGKGNDVLTRLGRSYAVIHLAGMILNDIPGFEFDLEDVMESNYKSIADGNNTTYDKPKDLMINFLEWLDSERPHIKYDHETDDDRAKTFAIWKPEGIYVPTKVAKDFLDIESKQIRQQWQVRGFTETFAGGDTSPVKYDKRPIRCLKIPNTVVKALGFDFARYTQ